MRAAAKIAGGPHERRGVAVDRGRRGQARAAAVRARVGARRAGGQRAQQRGADRAADLLARC